MDSSKALISALLAEGLGSYKQAIAAGLSPDRLVGEGRSALSWVIEYVKETSQLPTPELVLQMTGTALGPSEAPSSFLIKHVNNNHLLARLQEMTLAAQAIQNDLEKRGAATNGADTLALIQATVSKIQTEFVGSLGVGKLTDFDDMLAFYDRLKAGERGIPSPWPTLNESTLGFWPEDLVLLAARMGTGKCLTADTLITDPKSGIPRTIEHVVLESEVTHTTSWSSERGTHILPIRLKHANGVKRCRKITLSTGRSVKVTDEHPLLTPEGWSRADDIKLGMTLALPYKMPFPQEAVPMPRAEIDIIAGLMAEGSTTGHHLGFSNEDPIMVEIMATAAREIGAQLKSTSKLDHDFVGFKQKNPALDLARKHKIWGVLAKHKTTPEAIWRLDPSGLARYLSIFWMCDGYVDKTGPCLVLASEQLVREIQSLLLRFGIQSSVHYKRAKCKGKEFDSWRLTMLAAGWETFYKYIPLWSHKQTALEALLTRKRNPNKGLPRVSRSFVEKTKAVAGAKGFRNPNGAALRRIATRLGRAVFTPKNLFYRHGDLFSFSPTTLSVYSEELQGLGSVPQCVSGPDLFWDEVVSIEDVGDQKIYDLTVDPTSCFIANDVIVHNSWVAIQLAHHAWKTPDPQTGQKRKVLIITTEMAQIRLKMRFAAVKLRIPYNEFTHGRLDAFQEQRLRDEALKLKDADGLHIIGGGFDFRMESVEAAIDACDADMVVLDGVYLIKSPGVSRTDQMANTFNEMKRLAKRKEIVMAITTQFNREVKKEQAGTVQAESIALSDVGSWNSDLIFGLIQTTEMKAAKELIIKPLKVREGAGTDVLCRWDFDTMDFSEKMTDGGGGGDADEKGTPLDPLTPISSGGATFEEDEGLPF